MPRDTFDDAFECEDCGREWNSYSAVMHCPCWKLDPHGYEHEKDTQ